MTTSPTLGQVLRSVIESPASARLRLSPHQWKTVRALAVCRTGALGGQLFQCTGCQRAHFVAHSCRNRHCPQCQGARAVDWLEQQEAVLLPIPYFHLVFTLPHGLNAVIRQNRRVLFKLLLDAASQTLLEFGEGRLKAQIGITAVLHTWSQTLLDHYHLHCIVTGGGVALDGARWIASPTHYLFPVRALSRMFRGKYLAGLKELYDMMPVSWSFTAKGSRWPGRRSSPHWSRSQRSPNGSSMRSGPLPGPNKYWRICRAIRIEWPSATGG